MKRGIHIDRVCKRCLVKDEDELHCFLKCTHSRKVWDILLPGNDFHSNSQHFHSWLEYQIAFGTPKHRSFIFTVIYSLWLARNKAAFEGTILHPSVISQSAISHLEEFSKVSLSQACALAVATRSRSGWSCPPSGIVKVNFDAGFDQATGLGTGGVVARDDQGLVLLAGCFDFGWCDDAKHAEVKAAQKAMDLASMMGFSMVMFEGDCKVVIDEIIRHNQGEAAQDLTEVEDVINGFLLGSTAMSSRSILFTRR